MWLTVDKGGRVKLWCEGIPSYFSDNGQWARPNAYCASSVGQDLGGWPALKEHAKSLGLEPGADGIAEVTIDIKRVGGE